jgi:hypothetical protein
VLEERAREGAALSRERDGVSYSEWWSAMVIPRAFSSGALSILSTASTRAPYPLSLAMSKVWRMLAVSVVLPWST